jgi:hypothetical protein
LPIPIVKSRYLPTISRLIGKTDGCSLLLKLLNDACDLKERNDWSTESQTTIKKLQRIAKSRKHSQSKSAGNKKHLSVSTFDQCFHTKDLKFQYFWLTPLTIPMVKDNRPMVDCEKTSRLQPLLKGLTARMRWQIELQHSSFDE